MDRRWRLEAARALPAELQIQLLPHAFRRATDLQAAAAPLLVSRSVLSALGGPGELRRAPAPGSWREFRCLDPESLRIP